MELNLTALTTKTEALVWNIFNNLANNDSNDSNDNNDNLLTHLHHLLKHSNINKL